ncbi:MAG TPA: DUF6526 family protein [Chitinophagaceae bacterium]|nr:DUF6526 family protein [Chitinophagaceae bacterium]
MAQNYRNHWRYIPLWHYITPTVLLAILIGSIMNLVNADPAALYSASLILAIAALLFVFYWYARSFALRAQDRAIRAEENFRHFVLTGKPLDPQLRMSQIVALRFASDEEFPILARRALDEKMRSREIKLAIREWKADYDRV